MKEIYTIIVTFNGQKWIRKCLDSLKKSSYPTKIIVVDNDSSDETLQIVSEFDDIIILKQISNLGFGKANNIGIRKAMELGFDYVFLLNQDAYIFKDSIRNLISEAEKNPDYGIISPLHFSSDEKTFDSNFKTYFDRRIYMENDLTKVKFVNAAAWFISKKCIKKTGLFEEWFSHYGEDRNYCNRVIFHNFKIGITEKSKIVHDRIIKRNFNKDKIQSKYIILNSFLNINKTLSKSAFNGLKQVFGLPKYFSKHYNFKKIVNLFLSLSSYFIKLLFSLNKIQETRKIHKK